MVSVMTLPGKDLVSTLRTSVRNRGQANGGESPCDLNAVIDRVL